MAGKQIVLAAIALTLAMGLVPVLADFQESAQNASGVSSTQSTAIGLILTIFVFGVAYKAYEMVV